MPPGSATQNNVLSEKWTSGYCLEEPLFEVGGHFLPRVLNEPFVYVPLVGKSLIASKSSILPRYNNRGSCQRANMTRMRSTKTFPGVITVVPRFMQCWHKSGRPWKSRKAVLLSLNIKEESPSCLFLGCFYRLLS